jgi:hypothetical protein
MIGGPVGIWIKIHLNPKTTIPALLLLSFLYGNHVQQRCDGYILLTFQAFETDTLLQCM